MNSPKRVLLVEDFEDSRTGLSRLLQSEGYEVLEAADGAQAIQLAIGSRPDIILMDLSLPIIDGVTATRRIKENEDMRSVPIVALTAHEEEDVGQRIESVGYVDFLTKPVNFSVLVALLAKHLAK
ncbi:MAG TPA: response regulator [Blastocatellia bacterium]|nr:response regulator [Blastocatellia bacterium]